MRPVVSRSLATVALAVAMMLAGACSDDDETTGSGNPSSEGAELYARHCASCHGSDLRGTDQGPSHLSKVYEPSHHPDASFRAAIANGTVAHHWRFGDMPPVPGLDDAEVTAIIEFVRDQQEQHGFEAYPPS